VTTAPPTIEQVLSKELRGEARPVAFILAGHNGSGKSTLWYRRLADHLRIPLVNADRLTMSILPEPSGNPPRVPPWAQSLRDENETWQGLSQSGVRLFRELIMERRQAFAFETVFSHWKELPGGKVESKIDDIKAMQGSGYVVVLIFVGLTALQLSILRVRNRKRTGGHDVPIDRLTARFTRTQKAVGMASRVADLTLMVDNSLDESRAFQFVRAQRRRNVLFDARDSRYHVPDPVLAAAKPWLDQVAGPFRGRRR
jgi:predicted ABC-type ATPase